MAQHTNQSFLPHTRPKLSAGRVIKRIFGTLLFLLLLAIAGLLFVLTATEYHPADSEKLELRGKAIKTAQVDQEFTILSWNIGYGALGDNADFFMDGGSMITTATQERVDQNMVDILNEVYQIDADVNLFQEVDRDSWRSHRVNQVQNLAKMLPNTEYAFATNYKTIFVPLGIPPLGKIDSGVQTISKLKVSSASREALPLSYSWPLSTVQLKRGQLVCRMPIEGSDKELVIINEHLDAYTDGEHHALQVAAVREMLAAEAAAGNYVIAGGDWNHTFSNIDQSAYPLLEPDKWQPGSLNTADFGEGWQFVMDPSTPTCRLLDEPYEGKAGTSAEAETQMFMIDGFIVSDNVEVESAETVNLQFKSTDHNPVVIKVKLKKG